MYMKLASVKISSCTGQIPITMTSILSLYSVEGLERVFVLYRFLKNPFRLRASESEHLGR